MKRKASLFTGLFGGQDIITRPCYTIAQPFASSSLSSLVHFITAITVAVGSLCALLLRLAFQRERERERECVCVCACVLKLLSSTFSTLGMCHAIAPRH